MRIALAVLSLALAAPGAAVLAQPALTPASAEAAKPTFSTGQTALGVLLDNPTTKAVLEKHVPALVSDARIGMARGLTLKGLQTYAAEQLTDAKLAAIDADLAKIPSAK